MNLVSTTVLGSVLLSSIALLSFDNDKKNTHLSEVPATSNTMLFTTNNANGNITVFDVSNINNVSSKTLITPSSKADGVYYDSKGDFVVQASRSSLSLVGYTGIHAQKNNSNLTEAITAKADLKSPREVSVKGNFYVVTDNADVDGNKTTKDGSFYIYEKSENSFTLRNKITVNFKVWSGTFVGNDFYAIVDTTNKLAIFKDFLATTSNTNLAADKTIAVEGIVRTHGITFDASSGTLVMTDIGSAKDKTDGGFHIISNAVSKISNVANHGTLAVTNNQVRVSGSNTLLGNPVDVAFDGKTVYIAEAANGKILAFKATKVGGNVTPLVTIEMPSASSVFLSK